MSKIPVILRRGLPRGPGGEPWPQVDGPVTVDAGQVARVPVHENGTAGAAFSSDIPTTAPAESRIDAMQIGSSESVMLRSGLPRVAGGEPWPSPKSTRLVHPGGAENESLSASINTSQGEATDTSTSVLEIEPAATVAVSGRGSAPTRIQRQHLRQGLPHRAGEVSWPTVMEAQREVPNRSAASSSSNIEISAAEQPLSSGTASDAAGQFTAVSGLDTVGPGVVLPADPNSSSKSEKVRSSLLYSPIARLAIAGVGLILVAGIAVLLSRWFLDTETGGNFLRSYPGEYDLPKAAPVGFPAWLGWQHFLNFFLMVLIIRSGLQIRKEQRPPAYWTPRGRKDGKVSLTSWFHQSLDLLWLLNGLLFIVLLFGTGQWMRVIPTSGEVFPNAISAALQYMSLDWPTDNGWVNYNSLQQLAYGTTIFITAPLAAATGFRMSAMWPKKATKLSEVYPMELARKLHFPVMIYFVAFIAIHVILVMSTGALRNLNHMYATQGALDPAQFADNWFGFWMFVVSLAVIAGAVLASRPSVLAPIASLFGKVSSR